MPDPLIRVFIGAGSNIEPERNLAAALERLMDLAFVMAVSAVYRTAAIPPPGTRNPNGPPDAPGRSPDYLNAAFLILTAKPARELKFGVLRRVENNLGRVRGPDRFADRTIDLDILVYGNAVMREPDLMLPDPEIRERPHLARCLLDLAPDLVLPDTGQPISAVAVHEAARRLEPSPGPTALLREVFRRPRSPRSQR